MVSASDGWPEYWAAWGEWRPPWQVMRVRRVSPGCFRFAPPTLRRYDDVIAIPRSHQHHYAIYGLRRAPSFNKYKWPKISPNARHWMIGTKIRTLPADLHECAIRASARQPYRGTPVSNDMGVR